MESPLTQEQLIDLAEHYGQQFFAAWLDWLLYAILVGVAAILFKSALENIAGYITFRFDKFVKVGTVVRYADKDWRIKSAGWASLVLENKEGFLSLPIKQWIYHEFIVLKDGHQFGKG